MANGEPPAEPAEGVAQWADLAGFGGVAGLDGNKIDFESGMKEADDHFGFNFETIGGAFNAVPGGEVDEAEAALGVGNFGVAEGTDGLAHPTIYESPEARHAIGGVHAIADDECGW